MIKKIYIKLDFRGWKLQTKLVVSFVLLIVAPMCLISYKYLSLSKDIISKSTMNNVYEIVKKNNIILDTKLSKIVNIGNSMVFDSDLYNIFNKLNTKDSYQLLKADRLITDKINDYLGGNEDVFSAELVTSYYAFGNLTAGSIENARNGYFIPKDIVTKTILYKSAVAGSGGLEWIPTYDFSKMFSEPDLQNINISFKNLISAVKLINISERTNYSFNSLNKNIERPVAIINLKEDIFNDVFADSMPINVAYYMVVSPDGNIVSHSNKRQITKIIKEPWIKELVAKRSGTSRIKFNSQYNIVCYDTSKITGWVSMIIIPEKNLMNSIINVVLPYSLKVVFTLIVLALFFAFFISGTIVKPVKALINAIKRTGEGNFNLKLSETPYDDEISQLIRRFNKMNYKIDQLIEENYIAKIREKETEIMSLNTQLNPHFLYNTINIINWIAIENKQTEISEMMVSLSEMLQYTVYNHNDITGLKEDVDWLKRYVFILEKRFEDRFIVEFDIDTRMYDSTVPKLFLQPFIENSIIHGFLDVESGGKIALKGWTLGEKRYFSVTDNGRGMSSTEIEELKTNKSNSIGIKNVERRIKLIYGDEYGVMLNSGVGKGLTVTIVMPL